MRVWASKDEVRAEVASVPENWLMRFALHQPGDVRKFAEQSNGKVLYRVGAVLDAIENGLYVRDR